MRIVVHGTLYESVDDFNTLMEYSIKLFDKNSSNKVRIHPAMIKYFNDLSNKILDNKSNEKVDLNGLYQELYGYVKSLVTKHFDIQGLRHSPSFMKILGEPGPIKHAFWNDRELRMNFRDIVG